MSWVCQGHQHKGEQPPFHFLENILPQSRRLEKCMQDLCHCLGHPWLLHVPETNRLKAFLIDIHWAFSTARNNSHFCIYQAALEFLLWQKWGHRETDFLCALLREGCAATSCFFFFWWSMKSILQMVNWSTQKLRVFLGTWMDLEIWPLLRHNFLNARCTQRT